MLKIMRGRQGEEAQDNSTRQEETKSSDTHETEKAFK
jgi:hypothetical protein